jgi:asparaginyl-tRNA synthetase
MMNNYTIKQLLNEGPAMIKENAEDLKDIIIRGWVRTKRESKTFCFLEINDGTALNNLQIVCNNSIPGYDNLVHKLATGSSVKVSGKLIESPGKGQPVELQADEVVVYGPVSGDEYPLQKKRHSFEFLREIAHLRARTNTFGAVARVRNKVCYTIHQFFQERGFLYLNTPIITTSDCEGAGEMFQVTALSAEQVKDLRESSIDYNMDFFGKKAYLTVSGQLEAETYACALGKVYTFGPTFRAEHSNTSRHLAEFWMVEPEVAFYTIKENMDLAEEFLKVIFKRVLEECSDDMAFFNQWIEKTVIETLTQVVEKEFVRISYQDAVAELEKAKADFQFPVKWGVDLQSEHEKYLTEEVFKGPVIVTDYPKEIKAFYMKLNDDNKTVRAMDVLVPRLGEIIGGSERESDYGRLLSRINESGLNTEDYWWYLDLRRFGSVPHAGFGLGLERLMQFITGMKNIRDVIPFPRAYKESEF